jgi:ABC-2 type transport system ATP-binding protein
MDAAISIQGVGKHFKRYLERPSTLKERLIRFRQTTEEFWALRDVDIDVAPGSTLGLIGPNGSGKTTLLKLIAGILRPTEGTITARGRIAALLALGAGFHPELTGRENVYLNASILGLSRAETGRLFERIVEFAELGDFIDTQVKFYSSGMYVRLGFAVAVHVDPAILLVDEVLAVGDIAFQRKCLDKVESFQREGRTIVFVTHAPDLVMRICDHVVLLDRGHVRVQGRPQEVVREFRHLMTRTDMAYAGEEGTKEIEIISADIFGTNGETREWFAPGDGLVIQLDLRAHAPVTHPVVSFAIHDDQNQFVFGTNTDWRGFEWPLFEGKHRMQFVLPSLPMIDGRFYVSLGVHSRDARTVFHAIQQALAFDIVRGEENPGIVFIPVECRSEPL